MNALFFRTEAFHFFLVFLLFMSCVIQIKIGFIDFSIHSNDDDVDDDDDGPTNV